MISIPQLVVVSTCVVWNQAVDGDRGLLELVRAAITTNRASYECGKLKAHVDWTETHADYQGRLLDSELRTTGTVHLVWRGEDCHYDYDFSVVQRGPGERQSTGGGPGKIIRAGSRIMYYSPGSRQAVIERWNPSFAQISRELDVHPRDLGFVTPIDFADLLADNTSKSQRWSKFEISRQQDDILIRLHSLQGSVGTLRASMAHSGNVTEFDYRSATSGGRTAKLTWRKLPDGTCHLAELDWKQFSPGKEKTPFRRGHVEVSEFSTERPAEESFTFDALRLVPDTMVKDKIAGNTYLYMPTKATQIEVKQQDLDRLSDLLKSRGFGAKRP
jgi:hypothetical protein